MPPPNTNPSTKSRIRAWTTRLGFQRDWYLIAIGAFIGAITAVGAVAFDQALHLAERLSTAQQGRWTIWLLPLIPMAGALITGILVTLFAADAKGHGVPQVLVALIKKGGKIPLRVGVVKVLASIFTVGSGGSSGAEGPIIQIGATAGSTVGQKINAKRDHMGTFVGCGAAAGMASIFNAPIAGVFFCLEVLLRDFSLRTFAPIVIAAVISSATTQAILNAIHGDSAAASEAIFAVDRTIHAYTFTAAELPSYTLLGLLCGGLAVAFSKTLHKGEDLFAKLKVHPILKPATGAFLLGALGILFLLTTQNGLHPNSPVPAFFGNGYETIRSLLSPDAYNTITNNKDPSAISIGLLALLALVVCKALATTFTLASGGSGGVFAPSLFIGAAFGGAFGVILEQLNLMPEGNTPAGYALVGMAAVVAASTHAPLTSILLLFELTRDVYVLLPVMLACIVATTVARIIDDDSIYTAPLRRMGLTVGTSMDLTILRRIPVTTVDTHPLPTEPVYPSDPLSKLIALHAYRSVPDFVVTDQSGHYVGIVTGADMRAALIDREAVPLLLVAELLRTDIPTITPDESLDTVMDKFAKTDTATLPMTQKNPITNAITPIALVSRANVVKRYKQALDEA